MSELQEDRAYNYFYNSRSPPMLLILNGKRTHLPLKQYITQTKTSKCPTVQSHCMQEDQARNEPAVYDSSYP